MDSAPQQQQQHNVDASAHGGNRDGHKHKPILAERFKTKMCQTFEQTGVCPYEARCMFAHGEPDLRTKQMNLHDNLVTEEAIKAFQRARMIAARAAAQKKAQQLLRKEKRRTRTTGPTANDSTNTQYGMAPQGLLPLAPISAMRQTEVDELASTMDSTKGDVSMPLVGRAMTPSASPDFKTPATVPGCLQSQDLNSSNRSFRHEPYAASPETPRKPTATTPSRQAVSPGMSALEPPMHMQQQQQQQQQAYGYQLPPSRRTPQPGALEKQDSFAHEIESYTPQRNRTPSTSHPMPQMWHPMPQLAPCACPDCNGNGNSHAMNMHPRSGAISPASYNNSVNQAPHGYGPRGMSPSHGMCSASDVPSVTAILSGRAPQAVLYQPCGPGGAMMRRGTPQMHDVMLA